MEEIITPEVMEKFYQVLLDISDQLRRLADMQEKLTEEKKQNGRFS